LIGLSLSLSGAELLILRTFLDEHRLCASKHQAPLLESVVSKIDLYAAARGSIAREPTAFPHVSRGTTSGQLPIDGQGAA
jgi:hypothetical protein